ncbi:hypothetical protein ABN028_34540 [Actinopolymorpha sp. B17G11]
MGRRVDPYASTSASTRHSPNVGSSAAKSTAGSPMVAVSKSISPEMLPV